MKKSKMISLAAAALLTVAPVIAPTVVYAADASNTTSPSINNSTSVATTNTSTSTNTTTTTDNTNASNPVITYNGQSFDRTQTVPELLENSSLGYLPLKGRDINSWVDKIMNAFTATASASDKTPVKLSFNNDSYNGAVAGKYPIVLTATNAQGLTTRLTFDVTVGSRDSGAKYAIAHSKVRGNVDLFRIRNGVVHNSYGDINLSDGTNVATFGTETINGVSYTRLNGPDSDMFVETDAVNGTYPLSGNNNTTNSSNTVTKTLMHTAIAYDADGHSTGKKYYAYRQLALSTITQNIKGSIYYNVQNTSDYVKASNIDGTKRTLKRNAYVYATSTRRADRTLLRKGTTITTYGGSYKFKNGKRYYRVEGATATNKRYVKVVNFE